MIDSFAPIKLDETIRQIKRALDIVKEYAVPTLLNAPRATAAIKPGSEITVDAYHARIYHGRVAEPLEAEHVSLSQLGAGYQISSICGGGVYPAATAGHE